MKKYNLDNKDINNNYFHFTEYSNINNIEEKGLLPKKGKHAGLLEENEKVFFVKGLDNLLILFDCWINVYKKKPPFKETSPLLKIGSIAMKTKYFPTFWVDFYFKVTKNSKNHKKIAYQVFDKLLEECVLLNLDIKENIDFKMTDIDEIKSSGYKKKHLITMGYSKKYSKLEDNSMDEWNLHTIANRGVNKDKIKLCYYNNSCKMKDILIFAINNTKIDLDEITPVLSDYLKDRGIRKEV